MNILIVEDESLSVMFLSCLLKQLGYEEIQATASGEQALELAETWKPDLVFMDIELAGEIDGIECAMRLREKLACPVVFATGYDNETIQRRAMATGASAYLLKPLSLESLRSALEKVFPS